MTQAEIDLTPFSPQLVRTMKEQIAELIKDIDAVRAQLGTVQLALNSARISANESAQKWTKCAVALAEAEEAIARAARSISS